MSQNSPPGTHHDLSLDFAVSRLIQNDSVSLAGFVLWSVFVPTVIRYMREFYFMTVMHWKKYFSKYKILNSFGE